ncbi:hypothetical protein OSJ77_16380 [Phyllobacterium sp. 0TCS1.6C]|uniref:hypothetical protein n=1 Tax=unclassified Phyllobacterium TaxID=2638441 RepID=UPI0022648243|nr:MULTISPECIES: hypothetical protein [unclassified Phyllobacterium]MCX8281772.1 hypothetical protein [Phyllobacterium sp. 0TCS1.6C]MCX8295307.1 hypothetical protein [Phyllobacterium sp. 0TCS1.6A]
MKDTIYASIRVAAIKNLSHARGGLGASELHGKRLDEISQERVVRAVEPLCWSKAGHGLELELTAAYKAHKSELGAVERQGAAIGMHVIAIVSPDWLRENGESAHDPENPRVKALIREAQAWVESWAGTSSCYAYRFDMDEAGSGLVDLFVAPARIQKRKTGKGNAAKEVNTISIRMAKDELLKQEQALDPNIRKSGEAMQSSWARWCQQHLDPRILRGQPKAKTGRDHIHAEAYKQAYEDGYAAGVKAGGLEGYEAGWIEGSEEGRQTSLTAVQRKRYDTLAAREAEVEAERQRLAREQRQLEKEKVEVAKQRNRLSELLLKAESYQEQFDAVLPLAARKVLPLLLRVLRRAMEAAGWLDGREYTASNPLTPDEREQINTAAGQIRAFSSIDQTAEDFHKAAKSTRPVQAAPPSPGFG